MARYLQTGRGVRTNRARIRIYVISALLVIGVVIAIMYSTRPAGSVEPEIEIEQEQVVEETQTEPTEPETVTQTETEPQMATDTETEPRHVGALPGGQDTEPEPPAVVDSNPEPQPPVVARVMPTPANAADPRVAQLINEAVALINQTPSNAIGARERLNDALPMPMTPEQRKYIKAQLTQLAEQWLFSTSVFPGDKLCDSYKVQSGDNLSAIGDQFKVPYEILMKINNITDPRSLQAGQTLKVINGPFHTRVYRSGFSMDLFLQNTYVRSFKVGLGKPGMETPTGLWRAKIGGKLIKPPWTNPLDGKTYHPDDPDYPLGSGWIGLKGLEGNAKGRTGFAIHGTLKESEIGKASSQGCIRMHNGELVLVYSLMMPGHSRVLVVE